MTPPALPKGDWHPRTVEWWDAVWASPMASQFAIVDRHALSRLALLVDDFESATDPKLRAALAAEIRAEGKAFGLTPLDRRRGGLPTEIADAVYCEDCGESFVPSRVDSRLCSGCRRA